MLSLALAHVVVGECVQVSISGLAGKRSVNTSTALEYAVAGIG
jgi:hypothetical protein